MASGSLRRETGQPHALHGDERRGYMPPLARLRRCCSSVVEHPLGKGEVVSSILTSSTRNIC